MFLITFSYSESNSQIIAPTGSNKAASQMIYYYDRDENDTRIQVTNTNDTEGVTIHVQIFRSFDADNDDDGNDLVFCDERDFVDFLTPNDTHVYRMDFNPFNKNEGETATEPGGEVNIDFDQTKGFVIITPVVSEADLSAISFQHLIGNFNVDGMDDYTISQNRDAVDFTTGEILPDGTVLDGVTGGYVLIQPEELFFNLSGADDEGVEIAPIAFNDVYGPAGLLGYNISPADITWTSFVFDYRENPTSCGQRQISCFDALGLTSNQFVQFNPIFGADQRFLCDGVNFPDDPGDFGNESGWVRIFVSGLGETTNHFGLFGNNEYDDFEWMFTKGERTEPNPGENCAVAGDEDGDGNADCADPDCVGLAGPSGEICEAAEATCDDGFDNDGDGATDGADSDCDGSESCPSCESGDQCSDGEDNDGDGNSDCADGGCDGAAGPNGETCEAGVELTCNDNQDNDGDGTADCDDPDCAIATNCIAGEGGGGGGCSVTTAANPSMLNFLLPLIVVGLVIGIRRKYN